MLRPLLAFAVILIAVEVRSSDNFLRKQSVLYGISSLTENSAENSTTCVEQLHTLLEAIDLKYVWALKAMDASGQPGSGFLMGNNMWLGSHSQCEDITNRKPFEINNLKVKQTVLTENDYPPFSLSFCSAYIQHNSTLQQHTQMPLENIIQLGLCVPQSCTTQELSPLLQRYINERHMSVQNLYHLDLQILHLKYLSQDLHEWLLLPRTIAAIVICVSTLVLVLMSTIYDIQSRVRINKGPTVKLQDSLLQKDLKSASKLSVNELERKTEKYQPNIWDQLLKSFSIYSNMKSLLKTNTECEAISALHGYRLFSMMWIIAVHSMYFQIDFIENVPEGFRLSESISSQIFSNSTYCVDNFLFLSGFLVSYTFYKIKKKVIENKTSTSCMSNLSELTVMLILRFLRFTPVYMLTILLTDVMFSYYRKTSILLSSEESEYTCPNYWWRNLLYINNLFPRSQMCLSWSWYLSVDMQFFLVGTIILFLSLTYFKLAVTIIIMLTFGCITTSAYKSYDVGYIPTMDEQRLQLDAIYDLPWQRCGPYLVGMVTGYVLVIQLEEKLQLRKAVLALMWIIFPLLNLTILFLLYGRQQSVEFSASYMGVSRTLWGIGLGWLFIACCTNNAGIANTFLSFRGWIPLSRLTYCCYLINPLIMSMVGLGSETSQRVSFQYLNLSIYGAIMITFFYAFWCSLLFESPYILITKIILKKLMPPKKRPTENTA